MKGKGLERCSRRWRHDEAGRVGGEDVAHESDRVWGKELIVRLAKCLND